METTVPGLCGYCQEAAAYTARHMEWEDALLDWASDCQEGGEGYSRPAPARPQAPARRAEPACRKCGRAVETRFDLYAGQCRDCRRGRDRSADPWTPDPAERVCVWCGDLFAPTGAGDQCAACDAEDEATGAMLDTGAALEAARREHVENARFLNLHRHYGPEYFA